jgi:hypothetical protein
MPVRVDVQAQAQLFLGYGSFEPTQPVLPGGTSGVHTAEGDETMREPRTPSNAVSNSDECGVVSGMAASAPCEATP